jgi:hypothetical protein
MRLLLPTVVLLAACAHKPLSAAALDETGGVAIVARIEDEAGPRSTVFRDDDSYRPQLAPRRIDDKEADRRLAAVLTRGTFDKDPQTGEKRLKARTLSRFELADSLRSSLLGLLPGRHPWKTAASPWDVARALESFLVQEVPANAPDYLRLVELGVDTVVEIVIEEYGVRSERGHAGVFLVGTARMFRIQGGELYHRRFFSDELRSGAAPLDPFAVAKNATLFAEHMRPLIAAVAEQVARDLTVDVPRAAPAEEPRAPKKGTKPPVEQGDDPL